MMGIDEAVVVNRDPGRGFRGNIVPSVFIIRRCVHLRKELFKRRLNREIRPAESADDPLLAQGVLLLGGGFLHNFRLPRGGRPLAGIPPVVVAAKPQVRRQGPARGFVKNKNPVGGARRPVHHPVGLIGAVVEKVHADIVRHLAHQGGIFFLAHFPVKQDHKPVARGLRGVPVGGIEKPFISGQLFVNQRRKIRVRRNVVRVQGADLPADNVAVFANAFPKPPADETALILQGVAFGLRQLRVFFRRFRGADRNPVPVLQPRPRFLNVSVPAVIPPVTDRNPADVVHSFPPS